LETEGKRIVIKAVHPEFEKWAQAYNELKLIIKMFYRLWRNDCFPR